MLQGGVALPEWAGNTYDAAEIAPGVVKRFFIGGGPVDEAVAGRDEFDSIMDGFTRFNDMEVILAPFLQDVIRDEVVVSFSQDLGAVLGAEHVEQAFVECDVSKLSIFNEKGVARQVIEDTIDMIPHIVFLKKSVVLHNSI